jgi:hypothetical protein
MNAELPTPRLRHVFRIDASLAKSINLGHAPGGQRRIVPIAGGSFTGPQLSGTVLPGGSADWQIMQDDGSSQGDIRITLQTDIGAVLALQARGVRHGPREVLARLDRGETVAASEYTFRTANQIHTTAPELQ